MHLFEEVSGGPRTEGAVRRRPQIALGRAGYGSLVVCLLDASSGDLPGVGCAGWGGLDVPFAVFDLAVVDVAEADEILDVRRPAEADDASHLASRSLTAEISAVRSAVLVMTPAV